MSSAGAQKRAALRALKQRGFVVQVGVLESILTGFAECQDLQDGEGSFRTFLESVLDALAREIVSGGEMMHSGSVLSSKAASAAVSRVLEDVARVSVGTTGALEIIDIFSIPFPSHLRKNKVGSSLDGKRLGSSRALLDAPAHSKADMFRMRYELLYEKTLRNPKFTPPSSSVISNRKNAQGGGKSPYWQLTAIDSLKGTHGDRIVLGMLTQLEEGSWFLEDLNGSIEVDLSEVETTAGLHTESSFVICQGRVVEVSGEALDTKGMDDDEEGKAVGLQYIFKVLAMGPPPFEDRSLSHQVLGKGANLFGGRYNYDEEESLLKLEVEASDAMFLIISDVFLDSPRVMAGLRMIFEGFLEDDAVPTAVILIGNFLSHPFGQRSSDPVLLSSCFKRLGEMVSSEFPRLADSCTFVVVPGPSDLGPGNILPRPAMPALLTEGFVNALPPGRVLLGTNPCRMRFMTQEIVVLREDLLHKMIRNCAVKPNHSDTAVMAEHMVRSLVDQCHLCPLPTGSRPTLWAHDHALWLFPTPHLAVIADKGETFSFLYGEGGESERPTSGILGMNPGSFGTDLSFAVYYPAERRTQPSSVDPDELASAGIDAVQSSCAEVDPAVHREERSEEQAMRDESDSMVEQDDSDVGDGSRSRMITGSNEDSGASDDESYAGTIVHSPATQRPRQVETMPSATDEVL